MFDWIHRLPTPVMALVVFAATYLVTEVIYRTVIGLATGERGRGFKAVSPGLLPPLGIIFGLLVAFLASQAWGDVDRAHATVNREASALRTVVLLSQALPPQSGEQLRGLMRKHVEESRSTEWPAMAEGRASLTMIPAAIVEALQATLAMSPEGAGQVAAQREIVVALESAADARRQRILLSQSHVNWIKWMSLFVQALCTLAAVALVHSDNRRSARFALGLYATAIAVCIFLIVAHDRPFTGPNAVSPAPLLQVEP
jgi:hypothetical protein